MHFKGAITGLTTAASIWVVGTLGLAIGMGYYEIALIGTFFIFLVLAVLKKIQTKFITKVEEHIFTIVFREDANLDKVLEYIDYIYIKNSIKILEIENASSENTNEVVHTIMIPTKISIQDTINQLLMHRGIQKIKVK